MEDPYITASGISYEREALLKHININGSLIRAHFFQKWFF